MITTYVSVALLIGLVLLVRRPFARAFGAKAAYALWALPLARLVLPPLPAGVSPLSWLGLSGSPQAAGTSPLGTGAELVSQSGTVTMEAAALPPAPRLEMVPAATEPVWAPAAETPSNAFTLPEPGQIVLALVLISLAGAVFLVVRQLHAQWQFARLIRDDSEAPSDRLLSLAHDVQKTVGLKRSVPVRASFLCGAPLVTGVLRPVILVPAWFELDYTEEEKRIALTHEAMHVKRADLLALQAAHFVAAVQWLNPVAWRALKAFRADQEAACDADVLALKTTSPRAYGATLLKAIQLSRPGSSPAFAAALPLNHSIKERFAMLQSETPTPPRRRLALGLSLTVGAAALLATATAQEADLKGGEEDTGKSVTRMVITKTSNGDRELVILTDPMADVEAQLDRLDALDWPEPPTPPTPPNPPEPPVLDLSFLDSLEGLEHLGELESLGALSDFVTLAVDGSSLSISDGKAVVISRGGNTLSLSLNEQELEALVETIEDRADAFEEEMERWAENFERNFEASFEMDMEAFEADMERIEIQVEAITD
ncbi:MAG: M56 family metallopeptidase, partial [Pseudomonadota bacterium]